MKPVLSLCIPTEGIVEWVLPVLDSIFSQNCDANMYEVVVCDNGINDNLAEKIRPYLVKHRNLFYYRSSAKLFLNQIEAFEHCNGELIKFINSRCRCLEGTVQYLIETANKYRNTRPIIYFLEGFNGNNSTISISTFNEFFKSLGKYTTYSGGIACWREDMEYIRSRHELIRYYFPHLVYYTTFTKRSLYIVDNTRLTQEIPIKLTAKSGYNIFEAIALEFPAILLDLLDNHDIDLETFKYLKSELEDHVVETYVRYLIKNWDTSLTFENKEALLDTFFGFEYIKHKATKQVLDERKKDTIIKIKQTIKQLLGIKSFRHTIKGGAVK